MSVDISDELVAHIREWLKPQGVLFFRRVKELKGKIPALLDRKEHAACWHEGEDWKEGASISFAELNGKGGPQVPHPIHFREGMAVRNAMRASGLCEGWDDHDFDDNWVAVVERAIEGDGDV